MIEQIKRYTMSKKMEKVTIEVVNGAKCFTFNGIEVDRETWEGAISPICCDGISDEDMCMIVKILYHILCDEFGGYNISHYVEWGAEWEEYDKIDEFRWREEEELITQFGGIYYEDME